MITQESVLQMPDSKLCKQEIRSCAKCKVAATGRCAGCCGLPSGDDKASKAPYYCSRTCQVLDRAAHRALCKQLQDRRALYRVGEIYQLIFYAWSEMVFQNTTSKLTYAEDSIVAHRKHLRYVGYTPFPPIEIVPPQYKNSLLAANQCTNALGFFRTLLDKLLADVSVDSHELSVNILKMPRRIIWKGVDGIKDPMTHRHEVLGIQLRSGEHFIVDATSTQFGFPDCETVVPWEQYLESRDCRVRETRPFGYWSRNLFNRWSPDPATVAVRAMLDQTIEDPTLLAGIRRAMMKASNQDFAVERDAFVRVVVEQLRSCIADLHRPDGMFEKIHGHSVLRSAPQEAREELERSLGAEADDGNNETRYQEPEDSHTKDLDTSGILKPVSQPHLRQP